MKKNAIYKIILTILLVNPLFAQEIVKGKVTDVGNQPLFGVNILVKGTSVGIMTSGDGSYEIKVTQKDTLIFSFVGMKSLAITVTGKSWIPVILEEDLEALDAVNIRFKKQLIESKDGKLIINFENSALTSGQTAFDILKNLPGVTIGQNDQILFRGASGVNVMMDSKMTYLSGNQLVNYLKSMSAEDLATIELITTPSAEFDATGNTGIINIVPKKNLKKGYAVDVRSSISKGKFWMTNQNLSTSMRTEDVSLYGSFDYKTPHSFYERRSGNSIKDSGNVLMLERYNESTYKIKFYTWRAGVDWQFLPKHNIGINYHGYFDNFKASHNSTVNLKDNSGILQSYIRSLNEIVEPYYYDAVSIKYRYDIDSLGKKLTADAHYTSYRNFSDALMNTRNFAPDDTFINEHFLKSRQPGFVKIKSAQTDAQLPFKKFTIKAGIKYAEVANDNRYRFDSLQMGNYVEMETMSNHFKYKERIAASYLLGSKAFNKTTVEVGLRLEYTNADAYTVKQDIANHWEYTQLFPSLAIGQIINDQNKIDFSLSRRINRPSYTDLNPVRWYTDQYFYWSGNPELVPEHSWVYSLTYSLKNKYIFSATYNESVNFINRRLRIDENGTTLLSQSDNFDKSQRFDFTAFAPINILSFWDVQLSLSLNHTAYPISQLSGEKVLKKWATTASFQQDFSLPKDYKINLSAYWFSSELRGIYSTHPTGYVDLGVRKSFFKDRLKTQFIVTDIFNTNRFKASSLSDITDYNYNDKPYSRSFGLSFTWHFGGELIKSENRKTEEQERL